MLDFDQTKEALDEIAAEIPEELFRELNGGIILAAEAKPSRELPGIYTMGEYHNDRKGFGGLGRYIVIYHGSFIALYGYLQPQQFKVKLKETLLHEFTHHIESLAGERGLEVEDEKRMVRFRNQFRK